MLFSVFQVGTAQAQAPTHEGWNSLLQTHVSATGEVNYKGFIQDVKKLDAYLKTLEANPPKSSWNKNEVKAYWINAYNAYTIKLVTDYYPVKSIKDIGSSIQIPFVNTPWDIKFITIDGEKLDLNNIEHGKLRKEFNDPLLHFALVCASKSCPILKNSAYKANGLTAQLETQARYFLKDSYRNKVSADNPKVSKLFDWYKMDFNNDGSVIDFINKYAPVKINEKAKLSYLEYNWELNE